MTTWVLIGVIAVLLYFLFRGRSGSSMGRGGREDGNRSQAYMPDRDGQEPDKNDPPRRGGCC
jgi:hypothetical protein